MTRARFVLIGCVLLCGCDSGPSAEGQTPGEAGTLGGAASASPGGSAGMAPVPMATAGSAGSASGTTASGGSSAGASAAGSMTGGTGGAGAAGVEPIAGASAGMQAEAGSAGTGGAASPAVETIATLYWLDINGNRVMRSDEADFGDAEMVARTNTAPDGIAVDVAGGKIYWSNMGSLLGTGGGSLQRANLDGSGVETIVPSGTTRTPKQIQIDVESRHVYWCDREGAKVWRVSFDGGEPEILISEHGLQEPVGVALDVPRRQLYFTDRVGRSILRMGLDIPAGEGHQNRSDLEELIRFGTGTMPIDLDVDLTQRLLYWTDRRLGTVHRASMDPPAGEDPGARSDLETLVTGLRDTIGLSLDLDAGKMYYSELGGDVWQADLDGSADARIASTGSASGVALAHLPKP